MTKRKQLSASERASELAKIDFLPQREGLRRADNLLRAMLNSPPHPFTPKARAKPKKRAK